MVDIVTSTPPIHMVSHVTVLMDIMELIVILPMVSIHVAPIRVATVGHVVVYKVEGINVCVQLGIMVPIVHTTSMHVMVSRVKMVVYVHCNPMELIHAIARVQAIMAKIVQY